MSRQQKQQSTILLVEEDDQTRPILKQNLQSYGYRVVVALDEEDALERVGGGLQADLILIDVVGTSSEEALNAGRRIREQAKDDAHAPLVVMAEKFGADVEGTNANVAGNDWITYLEDQDQLKNLLSRLLDTSST